jgi:hypothetical protein
VRACVCVCVCVVCVCVRMPKLKSRSRGSVGASESLGALRRDIYIDAAHNSASSCVALLRRGRSVYLDRSSTLGGRLP